MSSKTIWIFIIIAMVIVAGVFIYVQYIQPAPTVDSIQKSNSGPVSTYPLGSTPIKTVSDARILAGRG